MPAYFVFVRFFIRYSDAFPFERLNETGDDAINLIVEELRQAWWREEANRQAFLKSQTELGEKQIAHGKSLLSLPGRGSFVPGASGGSLISGASVHIPRAEAAALPSFEEIAQLAGWGYPVHSPTFPHGISHRHPLAIVSSKESAETVVSVVRDRVAELKRAAFAKDRLEAEHQSAFFLCVHPHFFVLAEIHLARAEALRVPIRIKRLFDNPSEIPPPEEEFLAALFPMIQEELLHVLQQTESSKTDQAGQREADQTIANVRDPSGLTQSTEAIDSHNEPPAGSIEQVSIRWADWAVGIAEAGTILFREFRGELRERHRFHIASGRQTRLLEQLARRGGKLERAEAVRDDPSCPREDAKKKAINLANTIKGEIHHIRQAIRTAIWKSFSDPAQQIEIDDPLPWSGDGWTAKCRIGYAEKDIETGRYKYRTYDQMTSGEQDLSS